MSPYLFLIFVEVLSSLLSQAESKDIITGVPSSPKGPKITHLFFFFFFFADDSMIFCKANVVEWRRVLRILGTYEAESSQKVNLSKTSLFFSKNTSMERKAEISWLSSLAKSNRLDIYLGLPACIGKSKVKAFNNIKEKVGKKLSNWRYKFLSQAGKEVLLKAVIQAIPTYCMSVFMLPASLCKDLNKLMQFFWWKFMANSSGIHWMSWEKMSRSKKNRWFGV
jgi:hypothetical protein